MFLTEDNVIRMNRVG